ncbi:MAG: glycerol-3-phosphate dehydrogenase [Paracoccaceae bacterium]
MSDQTSDERIYDIAVIGGGVNGCGIARDAVGRGLSVYLCEKGDIGGATSSWSTKLFHGGLRYLEYYEFRLVREALIEREALLTAMPHISWPLRFVLPHHKELRPWWLIRMGLFLYDNLAPRSFLRGTDNLDLTRHEAGRPLKKGMFRKGFEYSDGWVQDSRLTVLNARDAATRGATIRRGTKATEAKREGDVWVVTTEDVETGSVATVRAKALVNAGGPWVRKIIDDALHVETADKVRLVRGSHIITRKMFDHDKAYIFQSGDNRVIFAIPYEGDFTLIGTTDRDHKASPDQIAIEADEIDYLLGEVARYFENPPTRDDIVATYSGVRPLYDDGASSATAATRDYVLKVEGEGAEAPLLNVFGGKITTYRRLAESAVEKLRGYFPQAGEAWTRGVAMPGGDFPVQGRADLAEGLRRDYPFLDDKWAMRLVTHYGTDARRILGAASRAEDLGRRFGHDLTEAEVRFLMDAEWARSAEDVLWRRTKLGLRLTSEQAAALDGWMRDRRAERLQAAE